MSSIFGIVDISIRPAPGTIGNIQVYREDGKFNHRQNLRTVNIAAIKTTHPIPKNMIAEKGVDGSSVETVHSARDFFSVCGFVGTSCFTIGTGSAFSLPFVSGADNLTCCCVSSVIVSISSANKSFFKSASLRTGIFSTMTSEEIDAVSDRSSTTFF